MVTILKARKFTAILLVLILCVASCTQAFAADAFEARRSAWTLYYYGLFMGTGTDASGEPIFDLDSSPTRAQGITMLVRLIGAEKAAKQTQWTAPFVDVPDWAKPYVGYAYKNGLTNGTSDITFSPDDKISASQYLTFVLRALGYSSDTDFSWSSAWTLTNKLGITDGSYNAHTTTFTRGDVAVISASALDAKLKNSSTTLLSKLEQSGIKSSANRCKWEQSCVSVSREGSIHFAFIAKSSASEKYTSFRVISVTANGVPCSVTQYTTAARVKELCTKVSDQYGITYSIPNAFAVAGLEYNQRQALDNATTFTTVKGVKYPVIDFDFECVGTLSDGTTIHELFTLRYYIDRYTGYL